MLNVKYHFDVRKYELADMDADKAALKKAGEEIRDFLRRNHDNKYLLIIEGQASRNSTDWTDFNYRLSFQRALTLMKYWKDNCRIDFGLNCELQIAGSGDGRLNFGYTGGDYTKSFREHDRTLMRESMLRERDNQRFIIHILPKNILDDEKPQN